jgi:aquaporin Z
MDDPTKLHWPEYLMEAAEIGIFMVSACAFGVLLEHPGSPVPSTIGSGAVRRAIMGVAMGLTAIAIVYSPLGRRSGAHFNPCVTLTFLRLGRVAPSDALFYVIAQLAGAIGGVAVAARALGPALADPAVRYVVTMPGPDGPAVAFAAEAAISFVLMSIVLFVSNTPRLSRFTGVACGLLVVAYITFEAPLSGMSMNPARTLGSALAAAEWRGLWIYFVAPPLGMLGAAELYSRLFGEDGVFCAKLDHASRVPCIFCAYRARSILTKPRRLSWRPTTTTT